ncbi:hypothetical protein [Ligaoa zhengdingensis]|uniref:hypothetical protein n=1 Tax=Ligaoa zhengdingensis TaxID=2763658 RepID=UPI0031BB1EF7
MKKTIAIVLSLLMLTGALAGCSKKNEGSSSGGAQSSSVVGGGDTETQDKRDFGVLTGIDEENLYLERAKKNEEKPNGIESLDEEVMYQLNDSIKVTLAQDGNPTDGSISDLAEGDIVTITYRNVEGESVISSISVSGKAA